MLLQPSRFPPFLLALLPQNRLARLRRQNLHKIGVVSADGATTLDGLEAKLAEKAAAAGASAYNITSAVGNDKMSGTAVIYK
ncbi:putative exported protein [Salmonella enterica subsp. enterica]|uniref:Putative exported protein n=1 Tax=Salmonella enterica I TaxID=59201 RepID=A0A447PNI0_SALET|nr:putative exported protein [Salmonella enterica subsp. enterica]